MPLGKVHELTFLWFGLPGPLLTESLQAAKKGQSKSRAQALHKLEFQLLSMLSLSDV